MYACLGIAFLVCGITMNVALKRNFPLFYETNSCSLWIATIGLSFPLLLRAVINLIYIYSVAFKDFYMERFKIYHVNRVYMGRLGDLHGGIHVLHGGIDKSPCKLVYMGQECHHV